MEGDWQTRRPTRIRFAYQGLVGRPSRYITRIIVISLYYFTHHHIPNSTVHPNGARPAHDRHQTLQHMLNSGIIIGFGLRLRCLDRVQNYDGYPHAMIQTTPRTRTRAACKPLPISLSSTSEMRISSCLRIARDKTPVRCPLLGRISRSCLGSSWNVSSNITIIRILPSVLNLP